MRVHLGGIDDTLVKEGQCSNGLITGRHAYLKMIRVKIKYSRNTHVRVDFYVVCVSLNI